MMSGMLSAFTAPEIGYCNPEIWMEPGKQPLTKLIGKNFTTTTHQAIVIPYTKMSDSEEETRKNLDTKDYYKITLK